jgi:hypothetical protein
MMKGELYSQYSKSVPVEALPLREEDIELSVESDEDIETPQDDVVRIGDIISICRKHTEKREKSSYTKMYVAADSFMHVQVTCLDKARSASKMDLTLFKIESVCSITESKEDVMERAQATELQRSSGRVDVVERAQAIELKRSSGRELHYGDVIQLRHLQSDQVLAISTSEASRTAGSWRVVLQTKTDCNCWIRIMPNELVRDEGHPIKFNERFSLAFRAESLYFYLNLRMLTGENCEVNAYQVPMNWRINRFQSYKENSKPAVKYGSVIRLRHKDTKHHMCINTVAEQLNWLRLLKDSTGDPSKKLNKFITELEGSKGKALRLDSTDSYYYDGLWILEDIIPMKGGISHLASTCFIKSAITGQYLSLSLSQDLSLSKDLSFKDVRDVECFLAIKTVHENSIGHPLVLGSEALICKKDIDLVYIAFSYTELDDKILPRAHLHHQDQQISTEVYIETEPRNFNQGMFEILSISDFDAIFVKQVANFVKFLNKFAQFITIKPKESSNFLVGLKRALADEDTPRDYLLSLGKGYKSINDRMEKASTSDFKGLQMALLRFNFPIITVALCSLLDKSNNPSVTNETYSSCRTAALIEMIKNLNLSCQSNTEVSSLVSRMTYEVYSLIHIHPEAVGQLLCMVYNFTPILKQKANTHLESWFTLLTTVSSENIQIQTYLLRVITSIIRSDNKATSSYQRTFLKLMFSKHDFPIIKLTAEDSQPYISFSMKNPTRFITDNGLGTVQALDRQGETFFNFEQICANDAFMGYVTAALKLYSFLLVNNTQKSFQETTGLEIHLATGFDIDLLRSMANNPSIFLHVRTQLFSLLSIMVLSELGSLSFSEQINRNFCFTNDELRYERKAFYRTFIESKVNDPVQQMSTYLIEFWLSNENSYLVRQTTTAHRPEYEGDTEMRDITRSTSLYQRLNHLHAVMTVTLELVDRQLCGQLFLECLSRSFIFILIGLSDKTEPKKDAHWLVYLMHETVCAMENYKEDRKLSYKLSQVIEKLVQLYTLVLNIRNFRRAKNYLILFNHFSLNFTKTQLDRKKNQLPYDFLQEVGAIERLFRGTDPSQLGVGIVPDSISGVLSDLDNRALLNRENLAYTIEDHSNYILKLIFSKVDLTTKLSGQLISVHTSLLNDTTDLLNRLESTELIIDENLTGLKKQLDEISRFFSERRLKATITEALNEGTGDILWRTEEKLKELLSCVQPRKNSSMMVYTTAQNICRLNRIYEKLLKLWEFLPQDRSRDMDGPVFRLIDLITTSIFFILYDNPKNQKKIGKLLKPAIFDERLRKIHAIIKETSTATNQKPEVFKAQLTKKFKKYPVDRPFEFKCMLKGLSVELFNEDDSPNLQIQNIVCNQIIAEICSLKLYIDRSEDNETLAVVYHLLANCAVGNPIVIYQCRKVVPDHVICKVISRSDISKNLLRTLLTLYTNVYLTSLPGVESGEQHLELAGLIMVETSKLISEAISLTSELPELARRGALSFVVDPSNPVSFDVTRHEQDDKHRDLWKCLYSGDLWENKSGLLFFIQAAATLALSNNSGELLESAKLTLERLDELQAKLKVKNPTVILSILTDCVQTSIDQLTEYIRKIEAPDQQKSTRPGRPREAQIELGLNENFINYVKYLRSTVKKQEELMGHIARQTFKIQSVGSVFKKDVSDADIQACVITLEKLMKVCCETMKNRIEFYKILNSLLSSPENTPATADAKAGQSAASSAEEAKDDAKKEDINFKDNFIVVVVKTDIIQVILDSICESESFVEKNAALTLLSTLIGTRASRIQSCFLESLKEKERAFKLFMVIKEQLTASQQRIIEHYQNVNVWDLTRLRSSGVKKEVEDKAKMQREYTKMLLQLLQVACDNCHEESQNFMREQDSLRTPPADLSGTAPSSIPRASLGIFKPVRSSKLKNKVRSRTINMVEVVANYFIEVVDQFDRDHEEALEMLAEAIQAMIEFTTGPCVHNQNILARNSELFQAINRLLENIEDLILQKPGPNKRQTDDIVKQHYITIYKKLTKLLLTFLEGKQREEIARVIISQLNIEYLKRHVETIYNDLIEPNYVSVIHEIVLPAKDSEEFKNLSDKVKQQMIHRDHMEVIKTGVELAIILFILKEVEPKHPVLSLCESEEVEIPKERWLNLCRKAEIETKDCFDFYTSYITCVEIIFNQQDVQPEKAEPLQQDGQTKQDDEVKQDDEAKQDDTTKQDDEAKQDDTTKQDDEAKQDDTTKQDDEAKQDDGAKQGEAELAKQDTQANLVYFPIPFKCKFMTNKSKEEIIYTVSRESQQEKIENFLQKIEISKVEMEEQQKLGHNSTLKRMTGNWEIYNSVSYGIIIIINLIMLSTLENKSDLDISTNSSVSSIQILLTVLGALQLFFTVFGFACYLEEYKEKIIAEGKYEDVDFEIKDYFGIQHNDSILMKPMYSKLTSSTQKEKLRRILSVVSNREAFYHIFVFLPLCLLSLFYPILYPFLLLDIVKRSESVSNIVKSIFLNLFQLTMTGFLGLIVIYIFSVIAFMYFQDCYDSCDDYTASSTPYSVPKDYNTSYPLRYCGDNPDQCTNETDFQSGYYPSDYCELEYYSCAYDKINSPDNICTGGAVPGGNQTTCTSCCNSESACGQRSSQYNAYCDTLIRCFVTTLTLGIRSGGGIGEAIKTPVKDDSKCGYWSRMAFDLAFFVFIVLILLNVIFGIIIDTYADLRDKRNKIEHDILNKCYICGSTKKQLRLDSNGWKDHTMTKHSVFAYLAFIVYVSDKNEEDCSGLEKHVKNDIEQKDVSFFPISEGDESEED